MATFHPPSSLQELIGVVEREARESRREAYVVGGTVRDVLLARETRDLDVAVDREALAFARTLADALDGSFVELDEAHAIARVVLRDGRYVDVAEMRGGLEADLRRRDFTLDAMAVRAGRAEVIDLVGGLRDLDGRIVRMTSAAAFDDDPLRLLRAVRIVSELGFTIEQETARAIRQRASKVNEAARERRRDELARMFELEDAYGAMRSLDALGLLDQTLPELAEGRGVSQPPEFHVYDVFEHNMRTLEAMDVMLAPSQPSYERAWLREELWDVFGDDARRQYDAYLDAQPVEGRSRRGLLKLSALLHDAGKPRTRTVDASGRIRFFGHADEGARIAASIMRRLRYAGREERFVTLLVQEHLRPVQLAQKGEAPTRRALYRFYRDLGEAAPAVLLLALADGAASAGWRLTRTGWRRQVAYMAGLLVRSQEEEGIVRPPRLLTGRDIMRELGVPEGPHIGRWLEALREAQAAGEVTDSESALAHVRTLAAQEHLQERQGVERG